MLGRADRRHLRRGRLLTLLLALLATQLGSLVAPAYACGCGAMVPGDQQRIAVGREVSVVRWDGAQTQADGSPVPGEVVPDERPNWQRWLDLFTGD